jgi:hypothetical protein
MGVMKAIVAAALLILGSLTTFAQPENSQRPDYPRAVQFFHHLRNTLREDDREGMSRLIEYPLLVQLHGKNKRIRSRAEFLAHYDQIFDRGVRCEILAASDDDIWGNSHGFTVKHGALWFDAFSPPGTNDDPNAPDFWTKGTFKVMTINNGSSYPCKG